MLGELIDGEYEVRSTIGEGAFGVVYKAYEKTLNRDVALKMLTKGDIDHSTMNRFLAEGRNLAALNHPNVVQIYRLGDCNGRPYIAMEFVEGLSLRQLCRSEVLSVKKALKIMSQVAAGLDAIHGQGILHRDLSTNNVVVTPAGTSKILDLGLSGVADTFATVSIESKIAGTILYMAPEIFQGNGASFASDVHSFGVLLYESLSRHNPFQADNAQAVMYNIVHREAEPLQNLLPDLSSDVLGIVDSCLGKNPDDRPKDLRQISVVLAEASGLTSSGFYPVTVPNALDTGVSDSRSNPYLNRVMIRRRQDFVGRGHEVKRIYARLNANPGGSISIVGDRRIGKSSLLSYIYMTDNRRKYLEHPESVIMLFLDLQEEADITLEGFVRNLMLLAESELVGRIEVSADAHTLDAFKDLVHRIDRAGMRLVILFDEFEIITTNTNFSLEFFSFLRFLANHYNVVYLTSSARDLQALCHTKAIADSPFFNIFSTMRLGAFSPEETRDLIVEPARRADYDLEPYVDHIRSELAGDFPIFIQIACSHFVECFQEYEDNTTPNVALIEERFYDEAKPHYRFLWDNFEESERTVIQSVARGKAVPESLRHVLQVLESKKYVVPANGKLRLFSIRFQEFVRSEYGLGKGPSLLGRLFGRAK